MKKRFPAIILALALCLGLSVPACAADNTTQVAMHFDTPADSGIIVENKMDDFRLRKINTENNSQDYGEPYTVTPALNEMWAPPANADTLMHINFLDSNEGVYFHVYSDSDGDGVYDEQLFFSEKGDWSDVSVLPIPENGVYNITSGKTDTRISVDAYGFNISDSGSVWIAIDRLYELFGANTIVAVGIFDKSNNEDKGAWALLLTGEEPLLISSIFTDIPVGQWLTTPVTWAVRTNITNGTSENTFSPDMDCTQAQILTFLYRAERRSSMVTASAADMEAAVAWAKEKGIIGDDFDGNKKCTRATAVSYIWQALDKPVATKAADFADVDPDADYANAVSWAVENNIVEGYPDDTFRPDTICNRGVIVTLLYRARARLK